MDRISVRRLESASEAIEAMIPQMKAHHWILSRLQKVRTSIIPQEFKSALQKVLPYVDDSYAEEKLREFKNDPLRFVVFFTDGASLLEPLIATKEWYEPGAALQECKDNIDAALKDISSREPDNA